jgi:hypothetical protein
MNDELWLKQSDLVGIDINEKEQLSLLSQFVSNYKSEFDSFPEGKTMLPHQYFSTEGTYRRGDASILYSMIRHFKPSKIIEIGSGTTTFLSAQAILKNKEESGKECKLISIEPYPSNELKKGFPGLSQLIQKKVEDVPLAEFQSLQENDILFIDSSHVIKIGGDVLYEILEILPRLQSGVIVHFDDIFLPLEYPKNWVLKEHRFWTEQYILQALLTFNNHFKILWAGSYMYMKYPDLLEKNLLIKDIVKSWRPASFWIKKVK